MTQEEKQETKDETDEGRVTLWDHVMGRIPLVPHSVVGVGPKGSGPLRGPGFKSHPSLPPRPTCQRVRELWARSLSNYSC
jgi:hypothetical protein